VERWFAKLTQKRLRRGNLLTKKNHHASRNICSEQTKQPQTVYLDRYAQTDHDKVGRCKGISETLHYAQPPFRTKSMLHEDEQPLVVSRDRQAKEETQQENNKALLVRQTASEDRKSSQQPHARESPLRAAKASRTARI